MPIKIRAARPASFASIYLELKALLTSGEPVKVGHGTGFFYRFKGNLFLITNWHVVTGRNPDNDKLEIYPTPHLASFMLSSKSTPAHFLPMDDIHFYEDGKPAWLQLQNNGDGRIDIVAIPMSFDPEMHVVAINDFTDDTTKAFEPGREVVIVGYPFEKNDNHPFPIWKKAMIASEPGYKTLQKWQCLLDAPGRPGMSGSPVFFMSEGAQLRRELGEIRAAGRALDFIRAFKPQDITDLADGTYLLQFAGVYTGSYGDQSLDRLNLGRMLFSSLVDELMEKGEPGENPYAPQN